MKTFIVKASVILSTCLLLLHNQVNAQAKLSMLHCFFQDTSSLINKIDTLFYTVKNTGTQTISGITIKYKSDSMTNPSNLDSALAQGGLNPGDSLNLKSALKMKQGDFHSVFTGVVVWPIAAGLTQVDTGKTKVNIDGTLGIYTQQRSAYEFSLFPNPSTTVIHFETSSQYSIENVRIFNSLGKLEKAVKCINNEINVEGLSNGLYLLEVESSDHSRTSKLFLKQ